MRRTGAKEKPDFGYGYEQLRSALVLTTRVAEDATALQALAIAEYLFIDHFTELGTRYTASSTTDQTTEQRASQTTQHHTHRASNRTHHRSGLSTRYSTGCTSSGTTRCADDATGTFSDFARNDTLRMTTRTLKRHENLLRTRIKTKPAPDLWHIRDRETGIDAAGTRP
ncbi:MAG: hypothetical protein H6R19_1193 [Proteobacteria bacterium]|nr:hypothetical protein [Pseudomonadota bacterium]